LGPIETETITTPATSVVFATTAKTPIVFADDLEIPGFLKRSL
jgi:hypothetical protein